MSPSNDGAESKGTSTSTKAAPPTSAAPPPAGWTPIPPESAIAPAASAADPAERWRGAVAEVEKVSPLLAPALKEAQLLSFGEGEITIQLPPGLLGDAAERRRADIEAVFARHLGRPTRLVVRRGAAAPPAAGPAPVSIAQAEAAEKLARSSAVRETAKTHPNIREAARILDGGVDKIEEL